MSSDPKKYSLRPQARPVGDSTLEGGFRVFMSPADMNAEGLVQGDFISIQSEFTRISGVAVVWRATDNIGGGHKSQGNPVIRISEWLRGSWGFELKDRYFVQKWSGDMLHISSITLTNVTTDDRGANVPVNPELLEFWTKYALALMDGISLNGTFEVTPKEGFKKRKRQRFLVEKIEPSPPENGVMLPYIFDHQSKIFFDDIDSVVEISMNGDRSLVEFEINGLKGMRLQVETLTDIINKGLNFAAKSGASSSEARLTKPVIIQGISGTGKSELIENLSAARGCNVLRIEESIVSSISSKTEANLEKFFDEAIAKQPALILIDDIHFIAGKSDSSGFARSLSRHIRRAARHRVQTVATARDLTDVHDQIAPWFVKVIDLPIPNTQARLDILKDFAGEQCEENILIHIADRTHAFVALDLRKLWLCALDSAENKALNRSSAFSTRSDATYVSQQTSAILQWADKVRVSAEDFEVALSLVHASAMNEVYVEVPKVRWRDIGGSEEVKKHLQRVTKISSRGAELFQIKPTKGILLYGPPGCSKTLLAKAFATESGLNFLAVKGPELISKFVGDTEHNIREIFRKARAASPSVIFFDEFDAMARRDTGHDSLSPVTALLTEMDGVEAVSGVFVLAATNRPQVIDKALIRPGRIDKIMYVGPPTTDARHEILKINMRKRPMDKSVDLKELANRTEGYSGADVAELCRSAANNADEDFELDNSKQVITAAHFEAALKKIRSIISKDMLQELEDWEAAGAEKVVD